MRLREYSGQRARTRQQKLAGLEHVFFALRITKLVGRQAASIADVVTNGLCIGCGLCESVTDGRVAMTMTSQGSLRPKPVNAFSRDEETMLLAACPGVAVEPRAESNANLDDVWGKYRQMQFAWATDPDTRHRGSTAGVLSALGAFLLATGRVEFILHVGSDPDRPMRNRWFFSDNPDDVIERAGSRYAPVAPLAGLNIALDRAQPFAIIAKPCDLNAVHRYNSVDPRVDELCVARFAMVCGGQSRMTKTQLILDEYGIEESEVTLLSYRGYGNPGPTRVETSDGRSFEKSYNDQWDDESTWDLETRCKLCPDALGEAADIAIADVWPNANPVGEDEGFSGVIVRTQYGQDLLDAAVAAKAITLGDPISPREFDGFQPHQTRKKYALAARYRAMADAGMPTPDARGLRLETLAKQLDEAAQEEEYSGTLQRIRDGRMTEVLD